LKPYFYQDAPTVSINIIDSKIDDEIYSIEVDFEKLNFENLDEV